MTAVARTAQGTTLAAEEVPGVAGDTLPPAPAKRPARKRTPVLLAAMATLALGVSGAWYWRTLGTESTDDAQVEGRIVNVSARVPGMVLRLHVEDNQVVSAGDVLVELDPADYGAKAAGAKADLAAAQAAAEGARATLELTEKTAPASLLQARGGMAAAASGVAAARAAIDQSRADVGAAESRRALAELNLRRARSLLESSSIAQAEVDAAQTELDGASARLDEARARVASSEASLAGSGGGVVLARGRLDAAQTAAEQVASARAALALALARTAQMQAALDLAELNLSYTTVRATRRGVISRRTVEEGQMVSPERPLLALVPLDDVWIVANFKEDQLAEMKPDQPATVRLDTYGRRELHGHVASLAGGTGARFALLPPDNATGNFVKVVQRLPVLIRIDERESVELRPGMSADVVVETARR